MLERRVSAELPGCFFKLTKRCAAEITFLCWMCCAFYFFFVGSRLLLCGLFAAVSASFPRRDPNTLKKCASNASCKQLKKRKSAFQRKKIKTRLLSTAYSDELQTEVTLRSVLKPFHLPKGRCHRFFAGSIVKLR